MDIENVENTSVKRKLWNLLFISIGKKSRKQIPNKTEEKSSSQFLLKNGQ